MERFLTPDAKQVEMRILNKRKRDLDPGIEKYLDQINELRDICTLQSCTGHRYADGTQSDGHLWLWMSQAATDVFREMVFHFADERNITRLATIYSPHREIVEIWFLGDADGEMEASLALILSFLYAIQNRIFTGDLAEREVMGHKTVVEVIDSEIKWCLDNPDPSFHPEYRKGFTNGLIQAKYLIGEMKRIR